MPKYPPQDQNRIICAAFALHNYIRLSKVDDPAFRIIDEDPNFIPPEALSNDDANMTEEVHPSSTSEMTKVRDEIAASLVEATRPRRGSSMASRNPRRGSMAT